MSGEETPSEHDLELLHSPEAGTGEHILIVDDSFITRQFLLESLTEPPLLAEVTEAEDGQQALDALAEQDFACVICDLEMPVMNGIAFLDEVRKHYSRTALPVLLLTSHEEVEIKVEGFRHGASDFIVKPWAPEELVVRVETQLSISRMQRALTSMAYKDVLTGLGNRRWFDDRMSAEFERARRGGWRMSMILLDVDDFKDVNDTFGHAVGDLVLADLGKAMVRSTRRYNLLARIGGDEFAILIPDATHEQAVCIAERIRMAVESSPIGGLDPGRVTVSQGVAYAPKENDDSIEGLFARSDAALYESKRLGRNKVSSGKEE